MRDRPLVAVFGPTGVGKTEVAVALAERLRTERGEQPVAVSADAFQVYAGLDTLTAKPVAAELERLDHRLISFVPVDQEYSVALFADRAHAEIDDLIAEGRRPIVVGGTGLYLRAALTELALKPPPDEGLRVQLERELAELGLESMHAKLPADVGASVHPHDRKRILRVLELERMGAQPHQDSDQLWSRDLRRPATLFGLVMDREQLGRRIDERVARMLEEGAVQDVELAIERGASKTVRKAIGFAEIEAHLEGALTLDQVRERIARRHRQYVRRQLTWMRKLAGVELIDRGELGAPAVAAIVAERLADRVSNP